MQHLILTALKLPLDPSSVGKEKHIKHTVFVFYNFEYVKENEMGRAYSTQGRKIKLIQGLVRKVRRKETIKKIYINSNNSNSSNSNSSNNNNNNNNHHHHNHNNMYLKEEDGRV
jgi:predicted RNA-binding protein YlqC (UPF0109 family)